MMGYRLNESAVEDIESLFKYGIDNYGVVKAKDYIDGLKAKFQMIADFPLHYQKVDEIREGYRRCVFEKHSIYYTVDKEYVNIMRVLRSQDPSSELHS